MIKTRHHHPGAIRPQGCDVMPAETQTKGQVSQTGAPTALGPYKGSQYKEMKGFYYVISLIANFPNGTWNIVLTK